MLISVAAGLQIQRKAHKWEHHGGQGNLFYYSNLFAKLGSKRICVDGREIKISNAVAVLTNTVVVLTNTVVVLSNAVGVLTFKRISVRELLGQNHLLDVPKTLSYPHTFFKYSYIIEIENYGKLQEIISRDYNTFSGLVLEWYFHCVAMESEEYTRLGRWWGRKGEKLIFKKIMLPLHSKWRELHTHLPRRIGNTSLVKNVMPQIGNAKIISTCKVEKRPERPTDVSPGQRPGHYPGLTSQWLFRPSTTETPTLQLEKF